MSKTATQLYEFEGPIKWAKVYEPDEFRGSERWSINVYLNEKQKAHYQRSGIQTGIKSDEDGEYVTFRRDTAKKIGSDYVEFSPPAIYDKDGSCLLRYVDQEGKPRYNYSVKEGVKLTAEGERVSLGNGSICKVRVSVYDTQMGKGSRLENIQIVDLIEYQSGPSVITAENGGTEKEASNTPAVDFNKSVDFSDMDEEPKAEKKSPPMKKVKPSKEAPW